MLPMMENSHLYNMHELHHATHFAPMRIMAHATKEMYRNPLSPWTYTGIGRSVAAGAELIERMTQRYPKPGFEITHTKIDGKQVAVQEEEITASPFCRLLHFKRDTKRKDPTLLIVAPMSGHHATLLRGTVQGLLPYADVYITDWSDAREVPFHHGPFSLECYTEHVINFCRVLGPDVHIMAVCQPVVSVFSAAAIMNAHKDPAAPASIILIGGPIDPRKSPTAVNRTALDKPLSWFESHVITRVPFNYPGFMRRVYPGFLQLTGFMSMNLDRHIDEHLKLFKHLIEGDGDGVSAHKKFYNEYLSVADLPAEFYLDTIDMVFQRHLLPKGELPYKDEKVDPKAITKTAILTLEGERDDISGLGQTRAAHDIVKNLAKSKQKYHMQKGVGHYGIFNGRIFRDEVVPIIADFMKKQG